MTVSPVAATSDGSRRTCESATDRMITAAIAAADTPEEHAELVEKTTRRRAEILAMCTGSRDRDAVIDCLFSRDDKEAMEQCYSKPRRPR